jgi:4-hydroxybenzoate polyprenyltransferase
MGYDTIYAHQDKDDDAIVGVGSSALALGSATKPALWAFYGAAAGLWAAGFALAGSGWLGFLALALAAAHLAWQIVRVRLDQPHSCLAVFRSNRDTGAIVAAGALAVAVQAWLT